jgi:hypothetical protein
MNRFSSIFSQLLQLFSRLEFQRAVTEHRAERHARGFTCWGQFVAMLFCQLGQAQSLREICGGLAGCEGKLKHLGVPEAPKRSTLAYANEHRPWELYQTVFESLFQRCQGVVGAAKKFRFRNPLLSIDSTLIDLCSSVFDWALYSRDKGAAKLHMVLDHRGYLPKFAFITEGKVPDLIPARLLQFEPGTIVVFDKGYVDYKWYEKLTRQGVFFVTRLRRDSHCRVVATLEPPRNRSIVRDETIKLGDPHHRQKSLLRLIEVRLPDREEPLILLTNLMHFGATTVAQIYKERWQIEVFFRALKQTLRIKTFVGTSANALKIQIWTALIAMLVLKYLQLRASIGWSLSNLVALLRHQLFVYRDLMTWLNKPFEPPPMLSPRAQQLSLGLAGSY